MSPSFVVIVSDFGFRSSDLKHVPTLVPLLGSHVDLLILGHHLMLKGPGEAATQLGNDDVAVAEEVDIEVDVGDGLARDVDLGDVRGEPADNLGDGGHLEGGADDDDEVDLVAVVLRQALGEGIGQSLAEEGDVGLHDASGGDVVLGLVGALLCAPPATLLLGAG